MSTTILLRRNKELVAKLNVAAKSLARAFKWDKLKKKPRVAIVLGSGLGLFCGSLKDRIEVPFGKITHMPQSAVPGHEGRWVYGKIAGIPVLVSQGRVHGYEGHELPVVTFPIRLMAKLGIQTAILTNAAGSVNPEYRPGDFVLLDDHINCQFRSPLTGLFDEKLGPRFVDMSRAYEKDVNRALQEHCWKENPDIRIHRGVYAGVTGPQYETPAEIRMLKILGGDVVGMSTVPETIVAKQCGLKVVGLSCVTNFGSGLSPSGLSHDEVAAMGRQSAPQFCWLLEELLKMIA